MPPVFTTFPDIEVVLIGYIKTLALPSGTIVSTSVPTSYDGSQLVCRVNRIGGPTNWPVADHPSVEVSCWGPDRDPAANLRDIVRLGLTWMEMAQVDFSTWEAKISNPQERLGPQWFDEDEYPPAGRYMFEVQMDLRNG